jgi:threonine synthase
MKYISTRGLAPSLSFEDAMLTGLALDGGLYVPEYIPKISQDEILSLKGCRYQEIAFRIIKPFLGNAFEDDELIDIIEKAYADFSHIACAPLVELEANHFLLELFHGPTLAFKDFAMQLIGQLFQVVLKRRGKRVTIIGATSGDTGSAAIEAFKGLDSVNTFILFPDGRVSDVQRRQMTTAKEDNVHAIAVNGTFDDCQARVKDMFNDHEFRSEVQLAGINSINWARVLAQVVYYFSSAVSLGAPSRKVSFTVPTGNFGDVFAGYIAKEMGLSIDRLVVATNQNDILHRCLSGNGYHTTEVASSISPSMDIQISSNFERALFFAYRQDASKISKLMEQLKQNNGFDISDDALDALSKHYSSGMATEVETSDTIKCMLTSSGQLLCPHTAIGVKVAKELRDNEVPMVTLATAHPAKFPDAVKKASKVTPELPGRMSDLFERSEQTLKVDNNLVQLKNLIIDRI